MDQRLTSVIILGLGFMLLFTAFQTMANIEQTVINSIKTDDTTFTGDGYTSLAVIYALLSISNWITPSVLSKTGPKIAMLLGALTYCFFIITFLWPKTWLLYVASAILGCGAALIWTGQGMYLSKCSDESTISRNSGIFWALLQMRYTKTKKITPEESEKLAELNKNILKRKAQLHEIEQGLPQKNSLYLKIILGDVNVSILNRNDKVRYKDDYEKFKLILNVIGLSLSFLNIVVNYRALELAFIFLLVWYYCTLTIRESILKVNGSRIKGWWRLHHFISTASAGVLLVWPQGEPWQLFRSQFMYFNVYISLVQYMQFGYQKGVLYRLKALGERHDMDITIEGFHSWMWRGLSFLIPFLFIGYIFQAYNAWTLYKLTEHPEATWQIAVLSILFLVLFIGNTTTTMLVIPQKLRGRIKERYRLMSLSWAMKARQHNKDDKIEKNDAVKGDSKECDKDK